MATKQWGIITEGNTVIFPIAFGEVWLGQGNQHSSSGRESHERYPYNITTTGCQIANGGPASWIVFGKA